ncbi:MAG TPA: hypothetical protein VN420_04320 [Candidatus Fimivivens sp.]|nr:hypothetical protein [Candidatus Fimivivens sp.]
MKWKMPPDIKIYEALGCIADSRIVISDNTGRVCSSSGNKSYSVSYDPEKNAIMANDNGSYWQGYLGYPSIAYLMRKGKITFDETCSDALKGIPWKNLNTTYKNDFDKTTRHVQEILEDYGISKKDFLHEIESIRSQIKRLDISLLGKKTIPPEGY